MTDTNQATDTTPATKYDHAAIAADLAEGDMTPTEIARKHGCSLSLVQSVRRKAENGGKTPPRNVARAEALRKKAAQFKTDFDLLAKWAKNEGEEDGEVAGVVAKIKAAQDALLDAADLYDALPEAVMVAPKRPSSRTPMEAGMVVRVKDKARKRWTGVAADCDHLKVTGTRDTHVLVEDTEGARLFIPRKDLEVRQDG